jgi:hypothetical protein
MDDDCEPELCIIDDINCTHIFKYLPDSDEIILWYDLDVWWYSLIGSKKICWIREGISCVFYKLYENGEIEYEVHFYSKPFYNKKTDVGEIIFAVSIPLVADKNKAIKLTDEMKRVSYFDKYLKSYFFRVTEEQYEELTSNYFDAYKLSKEAIKAVSYSYKEFTNDDPLTRQ